MSKLQIKSKENCRWDAAALGEIMLRLDPGEGRIRTARSLQVWEGGGEYNVVRGLRRCFGLQTTVVTAITDNEVGHLLEDLMLQGGVDLSHVRWRPFDGLGWDSRVGLNFTERGFGVRGAVGCSDRGHAAAALLKKGEIDFDKLFSAEGVRWFHCGGIFAGLSASTPDVVKDAMLSARANNTIISYDLNFRPSLWKSHGGSKKAIEVNREIAGLVDVMIGNEEDFTAALGFEVAGLDPTCSNIDPSNFKKMIEQVIKEYPNLKAVATTLRQARTATVNDWGAVLYYDGEFYSAVERPRMEILDRVGGGDSFASGLIFGFLSGKNPEQCVNYGAAHGALAMTTPGDTSMATLKEVEKLVAGGGARVDR